MKTELLFACHNVGTVNFGQGTQHTAKLGASYPKESSPLFEEMKKFWKATPSGSLEFLTINEAAAEMFKPGKLYKVTVEGVNE